MVKSTDYVVWLSEVDKEDTLHVGGKGANLGEMIKAKFPVPPGFVVTSNAYYKFIEDNKLDIKMKHLMGSVNYDDSKSIEKASIAIKKLILTSPVPKEIVKPIFDYYKKMGSFFKEPLVAIRSSATAEDSKDASFAGQQETYLNVKGESAVIEKIREAWASLFETRAVFYRHESKMDVLKAGIALVVQKMIESETSGVMFTIDPVTNDKSKVIIEAIYGLGEYIVQGKVNPDHYEVDKKTHHITNSRIAIQDVMLKKIGRENREVKVPGRWKKKQRLQNNSIIELAKIGQEIEKHYYFPQDIEWAKEKGKMYIVQTRPITTIGQIKSKAEEKDQSSKLGHPILIGDPASPGIGVGPVKILTSPKDIHKVLQGDILVAPYTNPDYVPAMKKAAAIVTERGGRTSHAAIVSREFGIPAVVGVPNAIKTVKDGDVISVNGKTGEIYKGSVLTQEINSKVHPQIMIKTQTKVYVNLAEPELAQKIAAQNVDGVGLLRAEFMIAEIGTHPRMLIAEKKEKIFIEKLTEGISTICKAFYPRPVLYRATDFKTNEYRNLKGGIHYEPIEPNPMLGFRGAYRYINDSRVFELELETIKIIRNKMGLNNLNLMIPFVRTVKELEKVKKLISAADLKRSTHFKLFMMVEIPSNVILIDDFIEAGIDGVSIGSNDLTMLILGIDRDNQTVAEEFDERNEAVMWALEKVIRACKKHNISSSICGQAPSTYPELVEKLVDWGITSVSVSPDAIDTTRNNIYKIEKKH
ncbi:phosphoenolpyruvate synthase [Candidatus Parcubacteria bacterium]|nr:MAG: phosphoenolpyruvate synthase [Candidatus Parcubacteria bacterium]